MISTPAGYKIPDQIKSDLGDLNKTNLSMFFFYVFFDYLFIWLPSTLLYVYREDIGYFTISVLYILCILLSSRSLRGLECVVHDGSHFNWLRKSRKTNDLLTNIFAAFAVFSTVENYRASHTLHHKYLGSDVDPDYKRHILLGLSQIDRTDRKKYIRQIITKLPIYIPSWWRAIGTDFRTLIKGIIWNLIFCSLFYLILNSVSSVIAIWLFAYFIPLTVFLPVLRFIGEAAEHDYEQFEVVVSKTFSNTGIIHRLLFHPHNDGYHTIHHILPSIPHYKLPSLYKRLKAIDKVKFGSILRERKYLFTNKNP
ncbi:fatty acid desaturase family protein [Mucilaginibacter psychrotolerans]|uniref:Fatty acid desaturase domain-containing protein n=1 Tax=Mucilaginibacter psychrotolerans TaxID=1524096 RepID=A0A4Y8SH18_9SPHI|nr:fatty acid desaturase family protein [Mucilaginibacter psychrotolerans]TFF37930.1 hypothetical protein E2R66_10090 [Mucilaginibacter psychrotolerans]